MRGTQLKDRTGNRPSYVSARWGSRPLIKGTVQHDSTVGKDMEPPIVCVSSLGFTPFKETVQQDSVVGEFG